MAIYRNDRERRILGDRTVARRDEFAEIHSAVGEVHEGFTGVHAALSEHLENRRREENEDSAARDARTTAESTVARMYSWAYNEVNRLLQPSWDAESAVFDASEFRMRLFPLGTPTEATVSTQKLLDGMSHFLAAAGRETTVAYPPEFISAATEALAHLRQTVADVTVEQGETAAAVAGVEQTREDWDVHYIALREVTSGFLRLKREHHRLAGLFRGLPRTTGPSGDAAADPTDTDTATEPPSAE